MTIFYNKLLFNKTDYLIGINNLAFTRGYGVFEFLRTYKRRPFALKEHCDRLFLSAESLGIPITVSLSEINEVVEALIPMVDGEEAGIKLYLCPKSKQDGFSIGDTSDFLAEAFPLRLPTEEKQRDGLSLVSFPYIRYKPSVKTLCYLPAIDYLRIHPEADDIIYTHNGELLEASTSNFFAVVDGELRTANQHILFGITRKIVLETAKTVIPISFKPITELEIERFSLAFLTSTTKEIIPVSSINGKKIPIDRKVLSLLQLRFQEYVRSSILQIN